jgi:DNA-binding NtrC family response regulator
MNLKENTMEIYNTGIIFGKKKTRYNNHPSIKNPINNDIIIPPNFKVLIIDDDIDFLKALEYRLTQKKIEVVAVESGYDALEVLNNDYFDLILLDLKMPGMNGAETFKRIKQIEGKPFVIIMTAYSEDEQVETVKKLDPFGFIKKPFDFNVLMPYIKKRVKEAINGN